MKKEEETKEKTIFAKIKEGVSEKIEPFQQPFKIATTTSGFIDFSDKINNNDLISLGKDKAKSTALNIIKNPKGGLINNLVKEDNPGISLFIDTIAEGVFSILNYFGKK